MAIDVTSISRFFGTEIITRNGVETFGRWSRPEFLVPENLADDDILSITVDNTRAGRPDQIAVDLYNSPFLEWVIVMFNRPQNPVGWPKSGQVIRAPSSDVVFSNI